MDLAKCVTRRVYYKKHELLTLHEQLGSPLTLHEQLGTSCFFVDADLFSFLLFLLSFLVLFVIVLCDERGVTH